MNFLPNERYLREFSRTGPLFPTPPWKLPWQPILWKNYLPPSPIAVGFRNVMGYRYVNVHINSINDACIVYREKFCELWSSSCKDEKSHFLKIHTIHLSIQ